MTLNKTQRRDRELKLPSKPTDEFITRFFENEDNRRHIIRKIKQRVQALKEDCGCDSYQKSMLCERAVFLALRLEAMEVAAINNEPFEAGVYAQSVNALSGLLSKLGLNRARKEVQSLEVYIEQQAKPKKKTKRQKQVAKRACERLKKAREAKVKKRGSK